MSWNSTIFLKNAIYTLSYFSSLAIQKLYKIFIEINFQKSYVKIVLGINKCKLQLSYSLEIFVVLLEHNVSLISYFSRLMEYLYDFFTKIVIQSKLENQVLRK